MDCDGRPRARGKALPSPVCFAENGIIQPDPATRDQRGSASPSPRPNAPRDVADHRPRFPRGCRPRNPVPKSSEGMRRTERARTHGRGRSRQKRQKALHLPNRHKWPARCEPTASITARRSSIRSSSVATATRSDRPVPRLSNMIKRLNDASRSKYRRSVGSSHCSSRLETNGGT